MKKQLYRYMMYFLGLGIFFLFLFIIASGNTKVAFSASNTNNAKSIQAIRLIDQHKNFEEQQKLEEPILYNSFGEAIHAAKEGKSASFIGKLTAYGPDCKGCGGGSACRPHQDFRNGNIFYQDAEYGTVRVVAADKSLPCGSIVQLHNIRIYQEPILAIVLDRGGAIKGNHFDLLFETEANFHGFSAQSNIQFDILRFGF